MTSLLAWLVGEAGSGTGADWLVWLDCAADARTSGKSGTGPWCRSARHLRLPQTHPGLPHPYEPSLRRSLVDKSVLFIAVQQTQT